MLRRVGAIATASASVRTTNVHGTGEPRRARQLPDVEEHLRAGILVKAGLTHVIDDADDFPRRDTESIDRRADGMGSEDPTAGERVVDEQHLRLAALIPGSEASAAHHPDAHGIEIVVTDMPRIRPLRRVHHSGRRGRRCGITG